MALGPAYGDGFVGISNPSIPGQPSTLYIRGSEFFDDSLRIVEDGLAEVGFQHRVDGAWADTDIQMAGSAVRVSRDLRLTTGGEWLRTIESLAQQSALVPHSDFDDTVGTDRATTPYVSPLQIRSVRQSDDSFEVSGMDLQSTYAHPVEPKQLWTRLYVQTGAIAATGAVLVVLRRDDINGAIFWQQEIPASTFSPAATEISFPIDGMIQARPGTSTHFQFLSDQNISLQSSLAGDIFFAVDLHDLDEEPLVSETFVLGNDLSIAFSNDGDLTRPNFVFNP